MCNTRPLMPAPGGAERLVGNNPIAIAVPSDGPIPIVLDMATSEAAMGKIRMAEKAGQAIPPNWAVNSDGSPTTNATEAIAGMLLPAAGPKGFGAVVPDRFDVRPVVRRRNRRGGATALWRCRRSLRLLPSFYRHRCRAFW